MLAATTESSYVLFLYEEGGIQWTTADNDGGVNGVCFNQSMSSPTYHSPGRQGALDRR